MFPIIKDKWKYESVISPHEYVMHMSDVAERGVVPEVFILVLSSQLIDHIRSNYRITSFANNIIINVGGKCIGVKGGFGYGAPAACVALEEIIALGAKKVIVIGMSGALQDELLIGDVIVCERAIRDEGTSYHYASPARYAYASKEIVDEIEGVMRKCNIRHYRGTSWSTDAVFRETTKEVERYGKEKVLCVEMEASALFTVAECRGIDIASAFIISDSLVSRRWRTGFGKAFKSLCALFDRMLHDMAS